MDKQIIKFFMDKGYLLNPNSVRLFNNVDKQVFLNRLEDKAKHNLLVINKEIYFIFSRLNSVVEINWNEFEKACVDYEKGKGSDLYNSFLDMMMYNLSEERRGILNEMVEEIRKPEELEEAVVEEEGINEPSVVVLKSYDLEAKKKSVLDYVEYFKKRYELIKKFLLYRRELREVISISRLKNRKGGEVVGVIGLVSNKEYTKNGNIILTLEDATGCIKVLINKGKNVFSMGNEINLDEVIAVSGVCNSDLFYCNEIILPDIPDNVQLKRCDDDSYLVAISDTHFGIKQFLAEEFDNFIKWLNNEYGDEEQKEIARKVKYLFFVGDLVEGIGIYPGQEKDLSIKDIREQYELAYRYFSRIPGNIKIIICGGNHDAMRISEPQPVFDKRLAEPLYRLNNLVFVSNPSYINIHSNSDFGGFDVLLYHGGSFPYYADSVDRIRQAGGIKRGDLIMHYLLQRRHLAPSHNSSLYIPESNMDFLVIDKVPDFFITGHIHCVSVSNYKNVSCINASCWVSQTEDQERRGIVPEPAKAVLVNLRSREVKIMDFTNEK